MKKYIVVWCTRDVKKWGGNGKERITEKDHYKVFVDSDSEKNYDDAYKEYNLLKGLREVYSANICELIDSTDY